MLGKIWETIDIMITLKFQKNTDKNMEESLQLDDFDEIVYDGAIALNLY